MRRVLAAIFILLLVAVPAWALTISLKWDPPASGPTPDGYRIFWHHAGSSYNYSAPAWQGPGLTCIIPGLTDEDTYFVCRAYNVAGECGDSNEAIYYAAARLPGQPTNFHQVAEQPQMPVTLVSGQINGNHAEGGNPVDVAAPSDVAAGDSVILGVGEWQQTPVVANISKQAGTATIGTIVRDHYRAGASNVTGLAIFRVPITGPGSLTMRYAPVGTNSATMSLCELAGTDSSPLGPTDSNNGAGSTITTNSIATTVNGAIIAVSGNNTGLTYTATPSNTVIYQLDNGNYCAFDAQLKIITGSPNTLSWSLSISPTWWAIAVEYKEMAAGETVTVDKWFKLAEQPARQKVEIVPY